MSSFCFLKFFLEYRKTEALTWCHRPSSTLPHPDGMQHILKVLRWGPHPGALTLSFQALAPFSLQTCSANETSCLYFSASLFLAFAYPRSPAWNVCSHIRIWVKFLVPRCQSSPGQQSVPGVSSVLCHCCDSASLPNTRPRAHRLYQSMYLPL